MTFEFDGKPFPLLDRRELLNLIISSCNHKKKKIAHIFVFASQHRKRERKTERKLHNLELPSNHAKKVH